MKVAQARVGADVVIAHKLTALRTLDQVELAAVQRDLVAITTALEGHTDCRFTVQWLCDPRVGDPLGGYIETTLLTAIAGDPVESRVEEVADDLLDLLNGPPGAWRFEVVEDEAVVAAALLPLEPEYLAAVQRRESVLRPDPPSGGLGFSPTTPREGRRPVLWSMWTLGPPSTDTRRLSAALLAQEAPVCIRMTLRPTELTAHEQAEVENLVSLHTEGSEQELSVRAAVRTLESMLYLRPLFEAHCLVASPEPLSSSLLSLVGHTLSEPTPHHEPQGVLTGGYSVVRQSAQGPELRELYDGLGAGADLPGLAPPGLSRLRSLLGVWEAANLFRLPIAGEDGAPGHALDGRPHLPAVLNALPADGALIGRLAGRARPVAVAPEDRLRHTYVVGQTGTGKSTLLLNLAASDIQAGHGVCVIDPHGDLVRDLLRRIPEDRVGDVVLIDPADPVAVPGVNLIEAESDNQRRYLVSETANMMYALFDPQNQGIVGPRFETILRNTMLLLDHVRDIPGSFLDITTVVTDDAVREFLSKRITDPLLAEYWLGEFPSSSKSYDSGSVNAWFRSKFEVFRTSVALRSIIGQSNSTISFNDVLREKRILLVNLSKGSLGEYDSRLLGHVIVMKLWAAVLERTNLSAAEREPYFLYIDEFQNVTTTSLASMLAEGRKYGIGLTLANQFFDQLSTDTKGALLGNVGTKLALRLGPHDAPDFAQWLGSGVEAEELSRLPNHHLVAALSPGGIPTAPVLLETFAAPPESDVSADHVRSVSRSQWARPLDAVSHEFLTRWAGVPGSFAARAQAQQSGAASETREPRTPPRPRSFTEEWLARRGQQSPDDLDDQED